jgi:hypothetical protein
MKRISLIAASLGLMGLLLDLPASALDPKTPPRLSSEKLETLLKGLKIDFKKSPHEKAKGAFRYDFERNGTKIRLINFNSEDLWIESIFNDKLSLEDVNGWNVKAKFSRCVLIPADEKSEKAISSISLEAQLDCFGGVTEGMARQFINRFDEELKEFAKYLSK